MPRDLSDVIDYFLPGAPPLAAPHADGVSALPEPGELPVLTLAIAPHDALRAAFAWNLTVELARQGVRAVLLAPHVPDAAVFWPEAGLGPVGAERVAGPAEGLAAFADTARELSSTRAEHAREGGLVLACAPPEWLVSAEPVPPLMRWLLLFSRPERRELQEAYALAKRAYVRGSDPLVGLTVHGARELRDAERAYDVLCRVSSRHLGRTPASYGLLTDDLHVYRAIAARRPIGLEHPQSRAARALRDVARMLWEDARKLSVG